MSLGAGALVIAIAAAIGVTLAMGRDGTDSVTILPVETNTRATATPRPTTEAGTALARAMATLTMYAGPGTSFISLGVIPKGAELKVVSKSDSEQWLEVIYPPGSQLKGWVELAGLEFSGDLASLPVGGAEVFALPVVPTAPPTEVVVIEEPTVEATPGTLAPDLVLSDAFAAGSVLIVTVTNSGSDMAAQVIDVSIYDVSVTNVLGALQAGPVSLASGESVNISTGFQIDGVESRRIVIVLNPSQTIAESDYNNNSLVFVLAGAPPGTPPADDTTPGPTPVATETPAGAP